MNTRYGLPMYYGAPPRLFLFAKQMRDVPTQPELALWKILSASPLSQFKFRRQHPISTFIADFYCHDMKLVIEVDGQYHLERDQADFDDFRDEDMKGLGIYVLRFSNKDVIGDQSFVVEKIMDQIKSIQSHS